MAARQQPCFSKPGRINPSLSSAEVILILMFGSNAFDAPQTPRLFMGLRCLTRFDLNFRQSLFQSASTLRPESGFAASRPRSLVAETGVF